MKKTEIKPKRQKKDLKKDTEPIQPIENNTEETESKTYTRKELEKLLNQQQKHFCNEFLFNNRVKSYMAAYPDSSYDAASVSATRMLENAKILQYINFLKSDIEELTGVSKIRNIKELAKIGFVSFEHINDTWIELKDWETIKENNPDILAAIESIDTKTEQRTTKGNFDEEIDIETKYVKVKLHSKIAAISEINKMMGYNAPEKKELTGKDGKDLMAGIILSKEETKNISKHLDSDC